MSNWVAKILATLLNFAIVIVLSRNLGAEGRGICAFYTVVIALALVINEMAAGSTVVFLQRNYSWRQMRQVAIGWSLLASTVVAFLFFAFGKFDETEAFYVWTACILNATVTIQYNILLGKQKYLVFNALTVTSPAICLALLVASALMGQNSPLRYLHIINLANLVNLVIGYLFLIKAYPEDKPFQKIREVIRATFASGTINQLGHLAGLLNSRYIYLLFAATTLGVFTNAQSIAESMLLIPGSLGQIYYAQNASKGDGGRTGARKAFLYFMRINIGFMLLGILVLIVLPPELYQFIFGPTFFGVKQYLIITGLIAAVYSVFLLISYWQSAQGLFIKNLRALIAGSIVNGIGILILWLTGNLEIMTTLYVMLAANAMVTLFALRQFTMQQQKTTPSAANHF